MWRQLKRMKWEFEGPNWEWSKVKDQPCNLTPKKTLKVYKEGTKIIRKHTKNWKLRLSPLSNPSHPHKIPPLPISHKHTESKKLQKNLEFGGDLDGDFLSDPKPLIYRLIWYSFILLLLPWLRPLWPVNCLRSTPSLSAVAGFPGFPQPSWSGRLRLSYG